MNWLLINKYGYDSDLATGWSREPGARPTPATSSPCGWSWTG